ncbi:NAD dependent epimerase/dehydratase family protein [Myriangium duriaei CBS 260.36]|uniref:NAD dependent epimerase/dehydratase family protein n=1 Tax=Myriangium duriaei CBS 260.36 TaxID=1168546 RepID=A0A9P4MGU4_9PEZI|nr:NAD dependent epimerase/dehydratase family protein [Myriangium duriaei CBS 260.36]
MPKVLVTGSSGHLGTALMLSLPSFSLTPIGIDILPPPHTTVVGSILDGPLISSLLSTHGISYILHTATLHKPHVASHPKQAFIDTNISGTLALLEAATAPGSPVKGFIFVSSTTTFGAALSPGPTKPAVWIDEAVVPVPKNIYGVTKVAAEDLCHLFHRQTGLPIVVLRTSRFFPEEDDDEERRREVGGDNLKVLELASRRVDVEDVVRAVVAGVEKVEEVRWGTYIVSAPTPFKREGDEVGLLNGRAREGFEKAVPGVGERMDRLGWGWQKRVDRVYDSSKAVRQLGWRPLYTFERALELLEEGKDYRSELTHKVGKRGYHATNTGVYTIDR